MKLGMLLSNGEWVECPEIYMSEKELVRTINSAYKSGRALQFGPDLINPRHVMDFRMGGVPDDSDREMKFG